jgi:hypothetical protein
VKFNLTGENIMSKNSYKKLSKKLRLLILQGKIADALSKQLGNRNHEERVLAELATRFESDPGLTPMYAWQILGIYRLSDVVYKLRSTGFEIVTDRINVNNRFGEECYVASYRLVQP